MDAPKVNQGCEISTSCLRETKDPAVYLGKSISTNRSFKAGKCTGIEIKVLLFKEVFQSLPTEEAGDIAIFSITTLLVAKFVLGGVGVIHGIAVSEILSNHPMYGSVVYGIVCVAYCFLKCRVVVHAEFFI